MLTYVHNFRYVVNYIGVREGRPTRDLPISTFLTDRSRQYRRQETKSQSDRSWQVMDGKQQWVRVRVRVRVLSSARKACVVDLSELACSRH